MFASRVNDHKPNAKHSSLALLSAIHNTGAEAWISCSLSSMFLALALVDSLLWLFIHIPWVRSRCCEIACGKALQQAREHSEATWKEFTACGGAPCGLALSRIMPEELPTTQ
jgi:hypothetical protein